MLRITLYKNCILNETYENVFSLGKINNETILEKYLKTLSKKTFDIDYVYQEKNGELVFDYEFLYGVNIYEFNYMKIETIDEYVVKLTRYCFISEILLKNELVYVQYSEDMWHSYIDKIAGINESYLSHSRITNIGTFSLETFNLPVEYAGNNKLNLTNTNIKQIISSSYVNIVAQVQYYKLNAEGEATEIFVKNVMITKTDDVKTFNYTDARDLISNIYQRTQLANIFSLGTNFNDADSFQIGNITLIPSNTDLATFYDEDWGYYYLKYNDTTSSVNNCICKFIRIDPFYANKITPIKEIETNANFKLKSIGTLSKQYDVIQNGTKLNYDLAIITNDINFDLYLNVQGKLINITSDFVVNLPYSFLTSEANSQAQLSRYIKNIDLNQDYLQSVSGIYKGIAKGGETLFSGIGDIFRMQGIFGLGSAIPGAGKIVSGLTTGFTDAIESYSNSLVVSEKLKANEAKVYSTATSTFSVKDGFINGFIGICEFYINSDNDDYVKKAINNIGYETFKYITNINDLKLNDANYFRTLLTPINYNTISFDKVSVYGSFPRSTAKVINEILMNGVKIWYNENLQEDNYIVG